jgi:NADPH-dependent glutamate synthase beta subunit-like oxidoreductase
MWPSFLTDAQLRAELRKCQSCETKPCKTGCPVSCSPADFIMAARCGEASDFRRAAAHILAHNPLGSVCGSVCPDSLCMARCSRRDFDAPVNIPAVQAAILQKARQLGVLPRFEPAPATGQRVAVVGAGPAGLGAASVLAKAGHTVHVLDRARRPGGMARLIPRERLDPEVLASEVAWLLGLGDLHLALGKPVALPRDLLARGFAAVIVAAGLSEPVELDVPGHERAFGWAEVLGTRPPALRGKRVAIVGDGGVALDCAAAALAQGASHVELFARKKLSELELTRPQKHTLLASGVHVSCRVRVAAIRGRGARVTALALRKVELPAGEAFHPSRLADLKHGEHERRDFDAVVLAAGSQPGLRLEPHPRVVYAGDLENGPTSVVEAVASGKKAGLAVHRMLAGDDLAACPDRTSCPDGSACPRRASCPEWNRQAPSSGAPAGARAPAGLPVSLATDFFGRTIRSPFLLSGTPSRDGYARMKRAYEAGWAGGVIEAAAGALDRVRSDVERLGREFPDRVTIASTGVLATDDHEIDARAWQAITRQLDAAGAMVVECSLSTPRDGIRSGGDVIALDPERSARIVDAVLEVSDGTVPKLFRISGAAESMPGVLTSIAAAFARHPDKLAGVTIAGSPSALANAARRGLLASSSAGALDHRAAAECLAFGARTVQLCSIATRYGLGIVNELHAGLSYSLAERGLRSVSELVGGALSGVFGRSGQVPGEAAVCVVDPALCTACGNCSRCPHDAVTLGARGIPSVDPTRCVGCSSCVEQCFTGALAMRPAA